VQNSFTIRIKPENVADSLYSKVLLAGMNDKKIIFARGGEYKNGYVEMKSRDFGIYFVSIDTIPPTIHPVNFKRGTTDLSNRKYLRFTIRDDFSGISKYRGAIDGKWALFEYDPKYNRLQYNLDKDKIGKGRSHDLELKVTDQKNNIKVYRMKFLW
jgi:hypothetical protein